MNQRIQKILAQQGIASRRQIEVMIGDGRIEVNNRIAELGDHINLDDRIKIDGRVIKLSGASKRRVLLYHKPEGEICTRHDPEGRRTVFNRLPRMKHGRWISVGRLDINSSGLLLFSNDGALVNRLTHPRHQVEREYAVRVLGEPSGKALHNLQEGVRLEEGMARFTKIQFAGGTGANLWYHVILTEGRYREVRRLWESQGITVSRLIRIRYGKLCLPSNLRQGHFIELKPSEVQQYLS